ncbi:MAG: YbhB/YbcL family Raf kinase inhibitor-like protein [Xanthomonadales bacterium]|nr:YbhB/YbcL family Raf kinase inhibitor-like protein [Xanthomonadales bacterium]
MQLRSDNFKHGEFIPGEFAFAVPADPVALSDNANPHLAWKAAPDGTRSFVLTCIDSDAPTCADDVNQAGRKVPADLPRGEFVHWLMANIPSECGELGAGSCSQGVLAHGKTAPYGPPGAVQGKNDYSGWFAEDPDMAGTYLGYDGPCPPWNDALIHHYHFKIFALDVAALDLPPGFALPDLRAAMVGHVLGEAELVGVYTLNKDLLGAD